MTNQISAEAIIREVRALAQANPSFVYTQLKADNTGGHTCRYEINGEPSCIVGQALAKLNVPIDVLRKMDKEEDSSILYLLDECQLDNDLVGLNVSSSLNERRWLGSVQRSQDQGLSWTASVETADLFTTTQKVG